MLPASEPFGPSVGSTISSKAAAIALDGRLG